MSRAQRIVVVWMAGALAAAVVYGLRALPGPEIAQAPAPPSASAPPAGAAPVADDLRAAITAYLRKRFDGVQRRGDPVVLAYVDAPLIAVEDAKLRAQLPDTRFFVTRTVEIHHLDPWPVVVSVARVAGSDDIRATQVITFGSAHWFLAQFLGVFAPRAADRRELTAAIAQLFARTMADGRARSPNRWFTDTYAELWFAGEHWRDITLFDGDDDGRIDGIAIDDVPRCRREIKISSR